MSSRRVAKLEEECLVVDHDATADPYALQVRPMVFEWLRDAGFPVEDVRNVYTNVSLKEDGNTGYLVMEIETLDKPVTDADAVADKMSMWVCSCPGYHYHKSPDLRGGESPSDSADCSHIERVKRKEHRPTDDESQATFGVEG